MIVGLFGTCGDSKWREPFMVEYGRHDIKYFNPVKDDWKPEDAKIEAEHLANDDVILFPVTDETLGLGSLGEVGFSILQAIKLDSNREIIVMIDKVLSTEAKLKFTESEVRESIKMRALVRAHLKKLSYPNVFIVETLDDMLKLSLKLNDIYKIRNEIKTIINK